jgi:hypothetical protein
LALNAAACPFFRTASVDDIVQWTPLASVIAPFEPASTMVSSGDGVAGSGHGEGARGGRPGSGRSGFPLAEIAAVLLKNLTVAVRVQ